MPAKQSAPKNMSEATRLAKNKQIREAGIATRARRATMNCRVRDLKISGNKLSKLQKTALRAVFLESKWIRNAALAAERFDVAYAKELDDIVSVRLPDGSIENREIIWLGSQMRQAAVAQLQRDLKALTASKVRGRKVGKLRFSREVNSIDLQQAGVTYSLDFERSRARIQNIPGRLPIRGLKQLGAEGVEFANAKLVQRADGYHLLVTTYEPRSEKLRGNEEVGVDFGVKTSFTLSDGSKIVAVVEEGERLRRLQRKLSRQVKGSNGHSKTRALIRREHLRLGYRRDELANQFVASLAKRGIVYFQDELISSWKRRGSGSHGSRKIQHGILGRVKTRLGKLPDVVMLPSWVATTAWCPACGRRSPQELSKRSYSCACGYSVDRDIHAAQNMVILGKRYQALTSGTEGSASGASIRLKEALYAPVEQLAVKLETATALVSP